MATTDKTDTTKKKRTSSGTSRKRSSSSKKKSSRTSKKTASTAKKRSTAAKRNSSKAAEEIKLTEQTSEEVKEQTQENNQEQQELIFDESGKVQEAETTEPEAEQPVESETAEAEPLPEEEPDNTIELIVPFEIETTEVSEQTGEPEDTEDFEQANISEAADESEAAAEAFDDEASDDFEEADEADEADETEEVPEHVSRIPSRLCGIIFVALLTVTFALNIIIPDKEYSDQENRVFQQMPSFSIGNYLSGRFESQLDNYANDQFMFRNTFIKIKSAADLSIGQLKANGVFKCKDSYLMEDITYPAKKDFDANVNALKTFKKKYAAKNMYFMLVPNAANILKSKLPGGVVTHDQNKDIDRLFGAVEALGYKTIDVRDELKKASRNKQIYYRTDHHWTTDGAYVGYQKAAQVMKLKSNIKYKPYVVKKDFVGTLYSKSGFTNGKNDPITIYLPDDKNALNSVIRYADTKEKTTDYYDMENLDKKDAYTVFGGTNHSLFSISTPVRKNRNLLVIKDSYANCFIPFLTQDYRTITVVDPRYYYENIATVIKANDIDEVLFLYNANTFFSDNYMRMMLTNK